MSVKRMEMLMQIRRERQSKQPGGGIRIDSELQQSARRIDSFRKNGTDLAATRREWDGDSLVK